MTAADFFEPIKKREFHQQELVDEIYAARGKKSANQVAREYGMTRNAVVGIWHRERLKRGGSLIAEMPDRVVRIHVKHDHAMLDAIYDARGQKTASELSQEYGITRNAVISIWRRERARRNGDVIQPRRIKLTPEQRAERDRESKRRSALRKRASRPRISRPRLVWSNPRPRLIAVPITSANDGLGVPYIKLGVGMCHWPLGELQEKPTAWCGDATLPHSPYCAGHMFMSRRVSA